MYNFNKELTFDEISIIFDTFLKCPDFNDCENCILNQDVRCTREFKTDYCTMLNHLAKALARVMDKEE